MNEHWTSGWNMSNNDAVPIPIPNGGMSPGNFASPRSESYGGGSLCRQVAETILSGSPATPKAPEAFRIADNCFPMKRVIAQRAEPQPQMLLSSGTPEFQPFLNTMAEAGMAPPQWNSMLAQTTQGVQQPQQIQSQLSPVLQIAPDISSPTIYPPSPPPMQSLLTNNVMPNGAALSKTMLMQAQQPQIQFPNMMANPLQMMLATQQLMSMNPMLHPQQQQQLLATTLQLTNQMQTQLYIQQQMSQLNGNSNLLSLQTGLSPAISQAAPNPFLLNSMSSPNRTTRQQPRNLLGDTISPPLKQNLILEEIKSNRNPALSLRDVAAYVIEFAKDQHGSRFIQQKLESASPSEMLIVYEAIQKDGTMLMTDVFGNYVVQKFFEKTNDEQRIGLCRILKGNVLSLSLQMYGCRVIQKAIETCKENLQMEIIGEIIEHVLRCIQDQNGNHVMQKIIECVKPAKKLQFIVNAIINERENRVIELAKHMYGCRVIQRVLEHCSPEQKMPIIKTIYRDIGILMNDQYGNYVIQHLVEYGTDDDREIIISSIVGKVFTLSQHKFSSNVIERILQFANTEHKNRLISEVCMSDPNDANPPLMVMMKDQFANYVVQKMLEVADNVHRKKMLNSIKPHMPQLRKVNYGKQLIAKLEKYFREKSSYMNGFDAPPPASHVQHHMAF
ncbi:unnamed protein product, partial [Mesorhabditis belari]|uniref:PUM-HD domain-containing protein n=1 Tax=Mesorhabditis belari TaxID=2138241 RepID=A0AAF3FP15_9BILA